MQSVDYDKLQETGAGSHDINIGITYFDEEDSTIEHSICWTFEPTFGDSDVLEIRGVLHKKYPTGSNIEHSTPVTSDGSEVVLHNNWANGPYEAVGIPEGVFKRLEELFGPEIVKKTKRPYKYVDETLNSMDIPTITSYDVEVFEIDIKFHTGYKEEIDATDPRVDEDSFTKYIKDGSTGKILKTYHEVNHIVYWWIEPDPTSSKSSLRIKKCLHKTWDDSTSPKFEATNENEEIVEAYESPPDIEIPEVLHDTISEWFSEELLKRSL